MTVKFFRVLATVGVLLVGASALAACNDSTTASAPLGTEAVTTTSLMSSDSASSKPSGVVSQSKAAPSSSESERSDTSSPRSTATRSEAPVSTASGVRLTDDQRDYLDDLKRQHVEFMGDTDNNVALTMGAYVCNQRAAKTDPTMIKAYVTAAIGPVAKSEADASGKADKIISAADKHLC